MEENIYMGILKDVYKLLFVLFVSFILNGCGFSENEEASEKLYYAITFNNLQACEEALRDESIDLEKLSKGESTEFGELDRRALGLAISSRCNPLIIEKLIENGADVNSTLDDGTTYLMQAILNEDYELCKLFLANGADVSMKNEEGYTAMDELFGVEQYESSSISGEELFKYAELLLDNGGEITTQTIERYIEANGYSCAKEMFAVMEQTGSKIDISIDIICAMTGNNQGLLEYLTDNEPSDKEIILRYAAANCDTEVLEKLKEIGCDFNYTDDVGQTLLHLAAKYNEAEVVRYVMGECNVKSSCTDFYQWTPLTMALIGENEKSIQMLLERGLEWRREGVDGGDSWIAACMSGTEKSVEMLTKYGFVPNEEEIVYGYENCNLDTIEFLIENNISYTAEWDECTGFELLCTYKPEQAKELLRNGAEIEITPEMMVSAIESYDEEFAKCVIDKASNLNVFYSVSPLECAIVQGDLNMVKYLIEKGANINYVIQGSDESHTAMHTAAENMSSDILEYLMEQGGDIFVEDSNGMLPLEWAKKAEIDDNIQMLEKK